MPHHPTRDELAARVKELLIERDALRREADLLRERLRRAEAALAELTAAVVRQEREPIR